jgi:hypothetical protein
LVLQDLHHSPRNRRPSFTWLRFFFSFSRRTFDPRVGFVARRFFGGRKTATIRARSLS